MSSEIKKEFGVLFRKARDAKRLSRAALAVRLGVSPKTIQSWEMGRTFIENLSLFPMIESELDINITDMMAQATGTRVDVVAESGTGYGKQSPVLFQAGPRPVTCVLTPMSGSLSPKADQCACVAVPVIRKSASTKDIPKLTKRDVDGYITIPEEWAPRGSVLVAHVMNDSSMAPSIPLGAYIVLDRKEISDKRAIGRVIAFDIKNKGIRVRRLLTDGQKMICSAEGYTNRGSMPYKPKAGDRILGRVVCVVAKTTLV